MANIIFVTNMEPHYVGMRDALNTMENKEISDAVEVIQINDSEQWNGYWQQKLQYADFFFCTWMGTGLSCDYLKKASAFLQQKKLRHLFDIIDPGDDKMDYGLQEEQKSLLKQYLACGGLTNYQNLCLYLVAAFTQQMIAYKLPEQLPWFRNLSMSSSSLMLIWQSIMTAASLLWVLSFRVRIGFGSVLLIKMKLSSL